MKTSTISIFFSAVAMSVSAQKLTACPAAFSPDCFYFCDYPTADASTCSNYNITTQGSVCKLCHTPTACPSTYNPDCLFFCKYPGDSGNSCINVDITTQGAQCTRCPGKPTRCPTTVTPECKFFCEWRGDVGNVLDTGCSNVNITTQGAVCTVCNGTEGTGTTAPPPAYTGGASALQVGSAAFGGMFALLLAAF
ncbi:hypothetical protein H072_4590 [Dactylellina haptotyla CBS 200.50]|uniref:TNFR-Cys domain-containing protein n=1 Tax=Dactylellina haptotyla (strain CBS 200.50) TaxID=1284197 RepID=S8AK60_DACHA|nr:hypothetical protein H072_4590 [Dactylellina haptotyla CBS 200.50]